MNILIAKGGSAQEIKIAEDAAVKIQSEFQSRGFNVESMNISEIIKNDYILDSYNFVYIVSYGSLGENGAFQSIVQEKGIPYSGSISTINTICKDKYFFNKICTSIGINIPKFFSISNKITLKSFEHKMETFELKLPVVIKPRFNGGSSIGLKIIYQIEEFERAILQIKEFDSFFLVQEYIEGSDYISGIMRSGNFIKLLTVGKAKINKDQNFYERYSKKEKMFDLLNDDNGLVKNIKEITMKITKYFEIGGMAYIDFRIQNNVPYVIEMGVMYGISEYSILPFSGKKLGMDLFDLISFDITQSLRINGEMP